MRDEGLPHPGARGQDTDDSERNFGKPVAVERLGRRCDDEDDGADREALQDGHEKHEQEEPRERLCRVVVIEGRRAGR
jgi:hypothetical protein